MTFAFTAAARVGSLIRFELTTSASTIHHGLYNRIVTRTGRAIPTTTASGSLHAGHLRGASSEHEDDFIPLRDMSKWSEDAPFVNLEVL